MEFNRSGQARPTSSPSTTPAPSQVPVRATATESTTSKLNNFKQSKLYRMSFLALLISGTVLFIAMIFFIVFGTPINREAKFVSKSSYQAVFVNVNGTNGGQVYFGHVSELTPQFIRLTNVFYIQNQQAASGQTDSSYNLVKLGCELHGPLDEMVINRSQVFFWENLKSDSQVAQKAAEFYKQNPNGQKCSSSTGSTQQSNTNTQAPATGTGTTPTTTPATTPSATTKKP